MTALLDAPSSAALVTISSMPSLVRPSTSSFSECGRTTTLRFAVCTTPSAALGARPYIASSSFSAALLPLRAGARSADDEGDEAGFGGPALSRDALPPLAVMNGG